MIRSDLNPVNLNPDPQLSVLIVKCVSNVILLQVLKQAIVIFPKELAKVPKNTLHIYNIDC